MDSPQIITEPSNHLYFTGRNSNADKLQRTTDISTGCGEFSAAFLRPDFRGDPRVRNPGRSADCRRQGRRVY